MKKILLVTAVAAVALYPTKAAAVNTVADESRNPVEVYRVESPDGRIAAEIWTDAKGTPTYSLTFASDTVVRPSRLGIAGKEFGFTEGMRIVGAERLSADSVWHPVWGEYAEVRDRHNELLLHLAEDVPGRMTSRRMDIRFRLFDDGMGFRYEFPVVPGALYWTVTGELTEFNLPADPKMFVIPGDTNTDEYLWTTSTMADLAGKFSAYGSHSEGHRLPELSVQTPMLMKYPAKGKKDKPLYVNLHEANLRDYGVLNLDVDSAAMKLKAHVIPDKFGVVAYAQFPFMTPWRTVIVSDDARDILASQLIYNLNEPCAIEDTSWIKPQKYMGVWWEMFLGNGRSWAYSDSLNLRPGISDYTKVSPSGRHAANAANVRKYIDFASANGIPGLLVEGWNEGWESWASYVKNRQFDFTRAYPDFPVDSLTAYAASKGVKLIMHHETAANAADYEAQLDTAFRFMKRHGYEAVKTGYVGDIIPRSEHHSSQWMVDHVLRVARKAADYRIMVDSHEAPRPTGLARTYPNWMAQESARGTEFEAMQGNPPEHTTILPFTRLKGGPMDYTPGIFEPRMSTYGGNYTHNAGTTLARQLALYLTMPSPFQMVCDLPENYAKHPDAFEFIKVVPVDWKDSRYLEAEPGDYITVARQDKNSDDWYVGAITDENPRTAEIPLSFLSPGVTYEATIYADGPDAGFTTDANPLSYTITTRRVSAKTRLRLPLAPGGGCAIRLTPTK